MDEFNVEVNLDQIASEIVMVKGEKGDTGNTGAIGPANMLAIGTVAKGDNAEATITGASPNQTLNLVLPKGDKGDTGTGIPSGGTTGQVVAKTADGTKWIDVYTKTETNSAIADKALKQGTITIPVASVSATPEDDEFKPETSNWNAHPFCYNYPISGLTADYECHINMSSNPSIADGTWQTMVGVLRIYLRSMPTSDITIQYTLQKAVA